MNATLRSSHTQKRVQQYRSKNDSLEYFNMLTSDEILNEVETLLRDHRERLFPPTETHNCGSLCNAFVGKFGDYDV